MQLPGRLAATTLGDLLGALHRAAARGSLEIVERGGRTHRVFLADGVVTAVELDRSSPTLAEVLRREAELDDEVLRRSLLRALAQRRLHGQVLVDDFRIAPSVVGRALRAQLGQRLEALERLSDCAVRFRVAVRAPREALAEPLEPEHFLHGRRRRRDGAPAAADRGASPSTLAEQAARRTLGVTAFADAAEIKRAYRDLVRRTHPDLHPSSSSDERRELARRFAAAAEAYRLLTTDTTQVA
ncbi:MAG: DnaJ domain-containing protein [Myxococcales bacterium]|nr:DnaJ domain-containing protein [Myxococcales bacterium]